MAATLELLHVAVPVVGPLHVVAAVWVRPRVAGLVSEQPRALAAVSKQLHVAAPVWVQLRASAASSKCSPFAALSYVALWYAAWSPCGLRSHVLAISLRHLPSRVRLSCHRSCVWRYVRAQSYVPERWCG